MLSQGKGIEDVVCYKYLFVRILLQLYIRIYIYTLHLLQIAFPLVAHRV